MSSWQKKKKSPTAKPKNHIMWSDRCENRVIRPITLSHWFENRNFYGTVLDVNFLGQPENKRNPKKIPDAKEVGYKTD